MRFLCNARRATFSFPARPAVIVAILISLASFLLFQGCLYDPETSFLQGFKRRAEREAKREAKQREAMMAAVMPKYVPRDLDALRGQLPVLEQKLLNEQRQFGRKSIRTAQSLLSLVMLHFDLGDITQAQHYGEQAYKILKVGAGKPDQLVCLHLLIACRLQAGDSEQAEELYKKAEVLFRKIFKDESGTDPLRPIMLCDEKRYAEAETILLRDLHDITNDNSNFLLSEAKQVLLPNLIRALFEQKKFVEAETYARELLKTRESNNSSSWSKIADLHNLNGPKQAAKASSTWSKIVDLNNLALIRDALGAHSEAQRILESVLPLSQVAPSMEFLIESERQQILTNRKAKNSFDNWVSVARRAGESANKLEAEHLRNKGRTTVAQMQVKAILTTAAQTQDPETGRLLRRLREISSTLSSKALNPTEERISPAIEKLAQERNAIERQLFDRLPKNLHFDTEHLSLENLQTFVSRLTNTALIDFLDYSCALPPNEWSQESRRVMKTVAFIVRGTNEPVNLIDLGESKHIAEAVGSWRSKVLSSQADNWSAGSNLADIVWRKLEPSLKGVTNIILSPSASLAKLPFSALPFKTPEQFLVEHYSFAVAPVPSLLAIAHAGPHSDANDVSLLAIGNLNYERNRRMAETTLTPPAQTNAALRAPHLPNLHSWQKLDFTDEELNSVSNALLNAFSTARVSMLQGDFATEELVKSMLPESTYLHFATHGFFAESSFESRSADLPDNTGSTALLVPQEPLGWSPGLLSGIVLSGANGKPGINEEDGMLTATEVGLLDLSKVELAVLSACETGLGTVSNGEGILGLQRAFQIAGARTTISSLWKVPDNATRELMTAFYDHLWRNKKGKLEALRTAQCEMLRQPGRGVKDWAGFVLAGDWQ